MNTKTRNGTQILVVLGRAKSFTRGTPVFRGLLDGGTSYPNLFKWR